MIAWEAKKLADAYKYDEDLEFTEKLTLAQQGIRFQAIGGKYSSSVWTKGLSPVVFDRLVSYLQGCGFYVNGEHAKYTGSLIISWKEGE